MKVFNKIRLGLFISIILLVGWNEHSSSIEDQRAEDGVVNADNNRRIELDVQAMHQDSLQLTK